jgi:hypothetical protein
LTDLAVSLLFLLGCCLAIASSFFASEEDRPDSMAISLMFLIAWSWSKILFAVHVDFTRFYWLTDSAQVAAIGAIWAVQPRAWKMAILIVFLNKAILHVAYRSVWTETRSIYILALNVLFAMELLCVAWPGGCNVRSAVGGWLSLHHGRYRRAVPSSGRGASDEAKAQ